MAETRIGMSYELLVEEGRRARREADGYQWTQGDLALELDGLIEGTGEGPRDEDGNYVTDERQALRRFADDVGVAHSTMRDYVATARAWPEVARATSASWAVHRTLNDQPDRFELMEPGLTVARARQIVRSRMASARGKPGWHELLGAVGDDLTKASKSLKKADAAITQARSPAGRAKLIDKAEQFAARADEVAAGLRSLAERLAGQAP